MSDIKWSAANQDEIAEFFGVAIQTVKGPWRSNGCPLKKAPYDLSEIARWRLQWERSKGLDAEATAKMHALKHRMAELELQEREGTLVSLASVLPQFERLASLLREAGTRIKQRSAECGEMLDTCLDRFERELSEVDRSATDD